MNIVPAISSKSLIQMSSPLVCFGFWVPVITVRLQDCNGVLSREPPFKYQQNRV